MKTEPKLQAAAEEEMQAASGNDLVLVEGEAPWEWHVIGTREQVDPNAPTDGHVFNYRTWSMDKDQVLHTKTEVASKTEDAPLSWLDDVLTSPDSPLSETAWRALGGGGMTASITGRWTPLTTDDGNKHSFPEGGAMEVRLRRRDVTDSTLEQPVSRSFLRVTRTGDQVTAVEGVTLTIEAGHKVSNVSTGTSTTDGSIVLKGKPDSTDTTVQVTDYLLPIEIMQHPADVTSGSSEPPTTQSVRLFRWLDAYDSFGEFKTSYPRYERDRIRVKIPTAPFLDQNKITIKIATKKPAGTNEPEDAATDLECEKVGDSFISKPIILVGDGVSAGRSGDDAWSQVSPQDEQMNDATHVASPGGRVEIELPLAGHPKVEFSIAQYTDKVKVKSYVVRSPSSNERIPADILTHLNAGVQRAKDVFKQAHIEIDHRGPYDCVLTDEELDLINSDRGDGVRTLLMHGGNANYLENGESQLVFDKIRALDGGGTDLVRIIYMDCDFVGRNKDDLALTIRDPFTGTNKFGVYEGFIVIPIKKRFRRKPFPS